MGKLSHASVAAASFLPDVFGGSSSSVAVKNTFIDGIEEEMVPQYAEPITRSTTAPCAVRRDRSESASSTGISADWDETSQDSSVSVATPQAQAVSCTSGACAAAARELPRAKATESAVESATDEEDYRVHGAQLRLNNTFLECVPPPSFAMKRCQSFPKDIFTERMEELMEGLKSQEADVETSDKVETNTVATPMNMDAAPFYYQGYAMPEHYQHTMVAPCQEQGAIMPGYILIPVAMQAPVPVEVEAELVVQEVQESQQSDATAAATEVTETATQSYSNRKVSRNSVAESDRRDVRQYGESRLTGERRRGPPQISDDRARELINETTRAYTEGRRSQVWSMARKDPQSSAVVQKAVEVAVRSLEKAESSSNEYAAGDAQYDLQALLEGLHGHVHAAIEHPHANYVIQKVVESVPSYYAGFIPYELSGQGMWLARHRFGCRIGLRLVGHCHSDCWGGEMARSLIEEVIPSTADLVYHEFGNYVIQEVLVQGIPEHQHEAAQALLVTIIDAATNQHGSRVVESALGCCSEDDSRAIAKELLKTRDSVRFLFSCEYGCFVLKALLKSASHYKMALRSLAPMVPELQKTWYSRRLVGLVDAAQAA